MCGRVADAATGGGLGVCAGAVRIGHRHALLLQTLKPGTGRKFTPSAGPRATPRLKQAFAVSTPAWTGAPTARSRLPGAPPEEIKMTATSRPAAGLLGAASLVLALGGCKFDNRPLLARGEPPPAAPPAPAPGPLDPTYGAALPAAAPALAPAPDQRAYAYPRRAYATSRAVARRRPDYAFAYGDEQPWGWETADRGLMFAEPVDDSWRYYYYEPGEAYPYFVQDRDYGYAYGNDGVLLALFDAAGALVAADRYHDYAPRASSYWTRAYDLHQSYRRSPHRRVDETVWRARAPALTSAHDRWFHAVSAQPGWREPPRHDNGRHLGWAQDHGATARGGPPRDDWRPNPHDHDHDRGRQVALAPAAPRDGHAWKQARQAVRPQPAPDHRGRHDNRGGQTFARAAPQDRRGFHAEHGRPNDAHGWKQARRDIRPQGPPEHRGPHNDHGGQAFARAAETHGRPAAAQAHGQAGHGGGPPHGGHSQGKGGGHKGGGHDKGKSGHGH
jgi:hypothetical protein